MSYAVALIVLVTLEFVKGCNERLSPIFVDEYADADIKFEVSAPNGSYDVFDVRYQKQNSGNSTTVLRISYSSDKEPYISKREHISFYGDAEEGNIFFKVHNMSDERIGTYDIRSQIIDRVMQCLTVFLLVKPNIPQIMNKITDGNRTFVRATEDQSVTLICVSRGGYPEPDVAWKKGASFLQPTFKEANIESDTTFTVTVKYTFISRRNDDRVQFTCQSSYGDTEPQLISSVLLYLSLKPSAPVMTGSSSANERDTRAFNCYSDGCRPTGNIFWRYNGSKLQRNVTFTNEPAETYRMESSYEASLQRADNDKKLECVVTHEALLLVSELVDFTILQIHFAPLSVTLSGNKTIIANGINRLELTCTTGSANPVAKITWGNGQNILLDGIVKTTFDGVYNGMVLRETLTLKPTRDMDGDIISCSTSNTVSSTVVQKETSLDLLYHSITSVPSVVNATDGDSRIILPCSASSKPPSHFKWFKKGNTTPLYQGTGTVISNALNYSISVINRSHAGQYRCEADNGIGTPDNTNGILILEVFYGPENVIFSPPAAEYIKREGEILHTITCVSDCYPGCTYIWNNGSADVSLTNTLSLGRLHRMDAATYFCLARNYETGVTRERNLTLHILHSPRPVAGTNSVITATPGTTVILSLTVIAYPVPNEYVWYKRVINDWIELYNFATVTKERTSLQFNLTISSFKKEDYGEYKLTVDNGVGNHMTYVFTVKTPVDETETEGDETEMGNETQDYTGLLVLSVCLGLLLVISLLTIGVLVSKRFLFRKGRMVKGRYKDGNSSAGSGTDDVQMPTFEGTNASTVPRDSDATNDHVYDEVKRRASQEHAYGQLGSNTGSTPKTYENFF